MVSDDFSSGSRVRFLYSDGSQGMGGGFPMDGWLVPRMGGGTKGWLVGPKGWVVGP